MKVRLPRCVFICAALVACGSSERTEPSTAQTTPTAAAESPAVRMERLPALGPNVHRGVCFAHSYRAGGAHGYGSDASRTQLEEVRDASLP